jgi:hypothetical protein
VIGAVCFIAFLAAVAFGTFLLIRADARAEDAAQRERDEATRRLILMLCEATFPRDKAGGSS